MASKDGERCIYKGVSILVLDYSVMERDVKNRLEHKEKYSKLGSDPRNRIRK